MAKKKHRKPKRSSDAPSLTPGQWWERAAAVVLCCITFPLLWVGGLVTTTKSGMAVPDWPGTYGYNLLLYPWTTWLAGPWDLFIEHGHRLLATLAGLLTIGLLVLVLRFDDRRWMRVVAVAALVGVILQGVLGGLRVLLDERLLAMVHGSVGPLFFALTAAIVLWTSATWRLARPADGAIRLNVAVPLGLVTTLLVFVQLVLGATIRQMPVTASPQTFAVAVKAHLFMAAMVAAACWILAMRLVARGVPKPVRMFGVAAAVVVLLQISLGVFTWLSKYGVPRFAVAYIGTGDTATLADGWWQNHIVTAHQATGSALLAVILVGTLLAWRFAPTMAAADSTFAPNLPPTGAATV